MDFDVTPSRPRPSGPALVKANGVRWNLDHLHKNAAEARAALADELRAAAAFQTRYQGKVGGLDAVGIATAMRELGEICNHFGATAGYISLRTSTDSRLAENKDLETALDRAGVEFSNSLRFFELEWKALPSQRAADLAKSPALRRDQHYLEQLTEEASHTLSADKEEALAERSTSAVSAWQSLFGETLSAISVPFDPGTGATPHTIDELLAYVHDGRPDVRRRALDTVYAALEPWTPVLAKCYDSLVGDRLAMDRMRHYVTPEPDSKAAPMQPANRSNDLDDAVVDTMIGAVENHYPTAQRYFRLKAKLMGQPKLHLADQYAPLGASPKSDFNEARDLVLGSMRRFSSRVEAILRDFFTDRRIDAEPRQGKRGGAFCSGVAQDRKPMVLMNFTDTIQDAETLAHELGHGLHFTLAAKKQSPFSCDTGMAMAEVASTFNEMVLFDTLLKREKDPTALRALVSSRIEESCATIFRQTMMARYEQLAYAAKEGGQALDGDRLSAFWLTQNQKYYGNTMELPAGYKMGWSYIPHFIDTRFYTYSYSFAHLASLALYAKYQSEGPAFVPKYLAMLEAGGSKSPAELLGAMGIDITDPQWVEPAFAQIDRWIDLAETGS